MKNYTDSAKYCFTKILYIISGLIQLRNYTYKHKICNKSSVIIFRILRPLIRVDNQKLHIHENNYN